MVHNLRVDATRVFLFMELAVAVFTCMVFTTNILYQVTVAGLAPLQLVLIGTMMEACTFLFEVPTGVVADAYSRRLSLIIGYLLVGLGFLVEGFFPTFHAILLAQGIAGLGFTFTSGATQAWITDEVGEERANQLFLRVRRLGAFAYLVGLGATVLIGANSTALPIRIGGLGILLTGILLAVIMPETGFRPTPREERNTWQHMWHIFKQGIDAVRARPRLSSIVSIALFYGLYSEGMDRLSTKLVVDTFDLPVLFGSTDLSFFVMLDAFGALLYIVVIRFVEKRLDMSQPRAIGRAMLLITGLISMSMLSFALSPSLILAVVSMIAVGQLRGISGPLQTAWINHKLDSRVRATIHSMFGQVDAIGQTMGGPVVGLIASAFSVRVAISLSSLLLSPALLFIRRANRIPAPGIEPHEPASEPVV